MQGSGVIAAYERMLELMQQMRDAACAERWDDLVTLERACRGIADALAAHEQPQQLSRREAQRKMEIIRQLLALDAAIRDRTEPWMNHLQSVLGTRERERKLHATYGSSEG